jgi:hypothetical protein
MNIATHESPSTGRSWHARMQEYLVICMTVSAVLTAGIADAADAARAPALSAQDDLSPVRGEVTTMNGSNTVRALVLPRGAAA